MKHHVTLCVLLALLACSSSGCAVMMLGMGHEGGSGSLSDAAGQARPDTTMRFKTPPPPPDVGYTVPPTAGPFAPADPAVEPEPIAPSGGEPVPGPGPVEPVPARRPKDWKTHRLFGGLVLGGGALGGREYDGFGAFGLSVGGYPEPRVRVDATVTGAGLDFKEQAYLYQAFQSPAEISLDVTVRFYLTPDRTFVGVYPLAGIGTGTLFWDYAKPVTVIEDGVPKQLDSDDINYFSFYLGAGTSLVQAGWVHIGGNLAGGVRFYGWHTGSGLDNDMLRTTGYVKVLVEVSFRVAKV
jgi:hypothetical protein